MTTINVEDGGPHGHASVGLRGTARHKLNEELGQLFDHVQRLRHELAAIERPAEKDHRFDRIGDQLDEIVRATEEASNTIIEAVEDTESKLGALRQTPHSKPYDHIIDQISENGMTILQACSFQDITGQRVTKLANALASIEARIDTLIETWGRSAVEHVVIEEPPADDEDALLQGPSLEGEGITQADIDALFD